MRIVCYLLLSFMLVGCGGSGADKHFSTLVSKVPVSALPTGSDGLEQQTSIQHDWEHPDVMEEVVPCDIDNEYGLNGAFIFEDLEVRFCNADRLKYSLLSQSDEMIFARRLPPIGDSELLIYRVNRTNNGHPDMPLWVLVMADQQGVALSSAVIAGADRWENDRNRKWLFRIDPDYVLTVKTFGVYFDEEGDENPPYDPNCLREINTTRFQISTEGIEPMDPGSEIAVNL